MEPSFVFAFKNLFTSSVTVVTPFLIVASPPIKILGLPVSSHYHAQHDLVKVMQVAWLVG